MYLKLGPRWSKTPVGILSLVLFGQKPGDVFPALSLATNEMNDIVNIKISDWSETPVDVYFQPDLYRLSHIY